MLNKPNHVRVVANILKNNPNPIIIPCHRVVRSDGRLGGYMYGKHVKKILLELEGITIKGDRIVEFKKLVIDSL